MSEAKGQQLPPGWAEATIEDLFWPLEDGRTLHQGWSPQCEKTPAPTDADWGVLKTTAIQAGAFLPQHNKHLPKHLTPRPQIEVKAGDILITCAGPRVRCGVACLVRNTRPRLMMSGKMYRFRVSAERMDARFLEAYLLTPKATVTIDRMKTGGSDSGLNLTHDRFRPLPVPVAPLKEQRRIVDAIDSYLTRLDDAVASLERVQAKLKAYRASVLKAAVEGRLVPTEASLARSEKRAYEPAQALLARILNERRRRWEEAELAKLKAAGKTLKDDKWKAKYKEPVSPDTGMLPPLPEGWSLATAAQITLRITDGEHVTPPRTEAGVLLLSARNVGNGKLILDEVDFISNETHQDLCTRLTIEPGDVLLSCSGTVGRTCVVPQELAFSLVRSVAVLKPLIPSDYLSYALASPILQAQVHRRKKQTAQANIFQGEIAQLVFPLPPAAEQDRIVAEISRLRSVADALEHEIAADRVRLLRLRRSVLKWAFEGKLVDQDATDEPAERLLSRIRAEHAIVDPIKKSGGRRAKGAA